MSTEPNAQDPSTHYQNPEVAASYDDIRFSTIPGRVFNALEKRTILSAFSDLPTDTTILDIPCGTGRLAEPLLNAGYRVHGMDVSEPMLDVARRRLETFSDRFTSEVADAKSLSNRQGTFRAALCARVLMHYPLDEQIAFLKGVTSVVTERVVINQSHDTRYQRFRRRMKGLLFSAQPTRFPISDPDIEVLLEECGFREVRRYRMPRAISEAIYVVAERVSP